MWRVFFPGRPATGSRIFGSREDAVSAYHWSLQSSGQITISLGDGVNGATISTPAGYIPVEPSGWMWLSVTVDISSNLMSLYRDATLLGTADISGIDLANTPWLAPAIGAMNNGGTLGYFLRMYVSEGCVYNVALTASEIAATCSPQPTLPIVPPAYRWGSAGSVVPTGSASSYGASDASTASIEQVGGGGHVGTVQSGTRTGGEGSYVYRMTTGNSGNYNALRCLSVFQARPGIYKISGWIRSNVTLAGSNNSIFGTLQAGTTSVQTGLSPSSGALRPNTAWTFFEFTGNTAIPFDGFQIYMNSGHNMAAGDWIELDDLKIEFKGATGTWSTAQSNRNGWQLHDRSPNRHNALLTPNGCIWTSPGERARLEFRGIVADAWLGGSARVLIPVGFRIAEIIATETSGHAATNLALGTTVNGTDIAASFSLAANETKSLSVNGSVVAKASSKPIHINDAPSGGSWAGASVDLVFALERL